MRATLQTGRLQLRTAHPGQAPSFPSLGPNAVFSHFSSALLLSPSP